MRAAPCTSRRERGYVLLSVLAALVVLVVVAARLDARVEEWRTLRAAWSDRAAQTRQLESGRDDLLACLLSRPLTPLGFAGSDGVLRVDGRSYRLPSGVRFSVQDVRGLISVVTPQTDVLRRYLLARGLPPREVESLLDKLADFMDRDHLRRLNGAEAPDYAAAGLAPPRDDWLDSPFQLSLVAGWHDHPELWMRASDSFSAVRQGWINPNTAPPAVLAALAGATPEGVALLLRQRELRQLATAADVLASSGIVVPDEVPAFYPGAVYRLRLWQAGGPRVFEYTAMLTLNAPARPWAMLETRQLPPQSDDADPIAQTPAPARPDGVAAGDAGAEPPLACTHLAPR